MRIDDYVPRFFKATEEGLVAARKYAALEGGQE